MKSFHQPTGYTRIKCVGSFQELLTTPFADGVNAVCWPRELRGDFGEIVQHLGSGEGVASLEPEDMRSLPVGVAGRLAIETILEDHRVLTEHDFAPVINCIHGYPKDEAGDPVATDVYSFHADSAPVETATWLCTYFGACSEGLRNEEAHKRVEIAQTREALLKMFGGIDGAEFHEYLTENFYDLHYLPAEEARPFSFGMGNLWRIAVDWPGSLVPPCIHRAPQTVTGDAARLILIG
jgi:hypothetical protein